MKISVTEKEELENIYQSYLNNPLVIKMKEIPMHRGSNCYIHSFKVAKECIRRASNKASYNLKDLLIAAVFHDYYLYDWREDHSKRKKHGRRHPLIAASNAKRDFNISESIQEIIKSHMWPLTPHLFPKTKEAKMLNYIDDVIATREILTSSRCKKKQEQKYIERISRLFD